LNYRVQHRLLNKVITERLGSCLPPSCHTHYPYKVGIQRIAIIYALFEDVWDRRIANSDEKEPCACTKCVRPFFSKLSDRHAAIYRHIDVPNIKRWPRLQWDVRNMRTHDLQFCYPPKFARAYSILNDLEHNKCFEDFFLHMQQAFAEKPHVLLSYTWLFYMALFFGGKFLYEQLNSADANFWPPLGASKRYGIPCKLANAGMESPGWAYLHFWRFDDVGDSEDGISIKTAFETGFHAASLLLTEQECQDVVDECKEIYSHLELIIYDLDKDCALVKRAVPLISPGLAAKKFEVPLVAESPESKSPSIEHRYDGKPHEDGEPSPIPDELIYWPICPHCGIVRLGDDLAIPKELNICESCYDDKRQKGLYGPNSKASIQENKKIVVPIVSSPNNQTVTAPTKEDSSPNKEKSSESTKDTSITQESKVTKRKSAKRKSTKRTKSGNYKTFPTIPAQIPPKVNPPSLFVWLWESVNKITSKIWFYVTYPFIDKEALALGASPWRF
jgi:hypothetical protein